MFLKGGAALDKMNMPKPNPDWITVEIWKNIL